MKLRRGCDNCSGKDKKTLTPAHRKSGVSHNKGFKTTGAQGPLSCVSYSARFEVEDDAGPGFRVAGRRQEVTAKSQASGIMFFPWRSRHRQVRRGWPAEGGRQRLDGVGAGLLWLNTWATASCLRLRPAPPGIPRVLGRCCKSVRTRSAYLSKRGEMLQLRGNWYSSREISSPWVARSTKESTVCASHRLDK